MRWSIGYDTNWNRDIGYGVPAKCDHPDCDEEIDRGLAYVYADQQLKQVRKLRLAEDIDLASKEEDEWNILKSNIEEYLI